MFEIQTLCIHQDVNGLEPGHDILGQLCHCFFVGKIHLESGSFLLRFGLNLLGDLLAFLKGQVSKRHLGALLGQPHCQNLADAPGASNYYGNLTFKTEHFGHRI
jgi:hypothetical protein